MPISPGYAHSANRAARRRNLVAVGIVSVRRGPSAVRGYAPKGTYLGRLSGRLCRQNHLVIFSLPFDATSIESSAAPSHQHTQRHLYPLDVFTFRRVGLRHVAFIGLVKAW